MTAQRYHWIPALLLLLTASSEVGGQARDVTFFVIGKHASFEQMPNGRLEPVDFSFFSEIFFTENGDASNAFLHTPAGERLRFRDQRLAEGADNDNLLLISGGKRFSSYAALQSWYPDGVYKIDFDTPSGSVEAASLRFPEDGLPPPPRISLYQDGQRACAAVDPGSDLEVRWSEFAQGGEDENGILDDLIFAILEDETGRRVSHSGRPFEGKPYLTYADSSHVISASAMQVGQEYTLSVEHAVLTDTQTFDSVPAMTTYAVTTRLKFQTGAKGQGGCTGLRPTTDGQIVMFYYKDLAEADRFYGEVLGFDQTLDFGWAKFYQTSANGSVGLVAEGEGAWHQARDENAVMLSVVTRDVDAWYAMLGKKEGVSMLKDIGDAGPIRNFLLEDPGGYTIEFFQWLEPGR